MEIVNQDLLALLDSEVCSQYIVRSTTDYARFRYLLGNRTPNAIHEDRLKKSIAKDSLFSPILVNEKFEIIDGQHRFRVWQKLKLPVFYIIADGYGLKQVQILNTNTSNWKKENYLKAYCDLGVTSYLKFAEFQQEFPMYGFQAAERLLTLKTGGTGNTTNIFVKADGKRYNASMQSFQKGELLIPDFDKSRDYAAKLLQFEPFFKLYNSGRFISAMLPILGNPNYNHDEMVKKLEMQPTKLVVCPNVTTYRDNLEDIYNFKRRDKISFRYMK